jgi:hypothetical protein
VVECVPSGVTLPQTAGIADGHKFDNTGEEFVAVKNNGAAPHIVTVPTPRTVEGLAVSELTNTVAAGATELMGPFTPGTFNQPSGADRGKVYVDYDASPGELMVGVVRVEKAD